MTDIAKVKFAFGIHEKTMLNHYGAIWKHLNPDEFGIILHGNAISQVSPAQVFNWTRNVYLSPQLVADGVQFDVLITNHSAASPLSLGKINALMNYSAGASNWTVRASYIKDYDVILSYGPALSTLYKQIHPNKIILEIGYPRHDEWFLIDRQPERARLLKDYNLDPNKKTLIWLPTYSGRDFSQDQQATISSLEFYIDEISGLMSQYNILVKPHPLSLRIDKYHVDALCAVFGDRVILNPEADYLPLYLVGDYFLFDYGGPMFGAIYADLDLLLLNVPNAESHPLVGIDSLDVQMRKFFPSVSPNQNKINEMLKEPSIWKAQAGARANIRRSVFAPYYGFSGKIAAECIRNIQAIFRMNSVA